MPTAQDQRAFSANPGGASSPSPEPARLFLMINSFETGGSERQFALLTKSLDAGRFSLELGCIQTKGPLRDLFGEVTRFRLGGSVYGWKSWHSRWQLSRHLERKKIQIAHAFDFYTNLTLLPAARWAGVPVVIASQRQLGDLLSRGQSMLQKAAFRLSDCIVCNSRAAAERLIEEGIPEPKVRVIGNALAPELFASAAPLVPRSPGIFRVGMIARMNARYKTTLGFCAPRPRYTPGCLAQNFFWRATGRCAASSSPKPKPSEFRRWSVLSATSATFPLCSLRAI